MKLMTLLRCRTSCLAALGILVPQFVLAAGPAKPAAIDVVLQDRGTLVGVLVDPQGKPMPESQVVLQQDNKTLATGKTNKDGVFAMRGLRGGFYGIEAANGRGVVRAWTKDAAPPAAHQAIQLVTGDKVFRGQLEWEGGGIGFAEATSLAFGITGTILGIIALSDDDEDDTGS